MLLRIGTFKKANFSEKQYSGLGTLYGEPLFQSG